MKYQIKSSRSKLAVIFIVLLAIFMVDVKPIAAANVWQIYKEAEEARAAGKHEIAIEKYKLSIELFGKQNETTNVALMYNKMAESQLALSLYDDAVGSWEAESKYWAKAGKTQESIAADRKADWVRSRVELFVAQEEGEQPNTLYHGAPFEPKAGALIGAFAEADGKVHDSKDGNPHYMSAFPELTGKKHAMYLLYTSWGRNFFQDYRGHIERAKAAGVGLQVALQPMGGLDEVKDGDYLRSLAREAKDVGIPIFLRFANEMNGSWVEWYEENPADYINKFRIVAKVFKEEAPGVAIVWAPGYFPVDNIEAYYPGDEYVDWVGVSMYQAYNGALDPLKKGVDRSSFIEKFENIYRLYGKKKPVFISEGGISYSDPVSHADKTDWAVYQIEQFYSSLPLLYPGVKGVFWFDTSRKDSGRLNSYTLSDNAKVLAAYKKAVGNPFYLSSVGSESPVTYKPLGASVPPKQVQLSAFVRTVEPILSKVVYSVGGQTVATATKAPWSFTYDFAPHNNRTVNLTVTAYSAGGKAVSARTVPIKVKQPELAAIPSASDVLVDGKKVAFDAYKIAGSNYFKLRDLAMALNGTDKKFEVSWDNGKKAIRLMPGTDYTAMGGELDASGGMTSRPALQTSSKLYVDGQEAQLIAYNIGGNNYFKLRDIAKLLDFSVTWDPKQSMIGIDTSISYSEN
ncbi:glycosyl hydrolase [Paenibacillus sp. LHD-117]|uniref:glycosyl hydrolase n=1 Tax=Paenibacillus sp. LHD-117 TaxID=3071412 RepID=UPI0027E0D154|nr:glycosyl hydrolase [Paenibacillus sp. LHD-117]MDQ6421005.1 glycosyl hydrolase [Paenibacillus sp. LHD-117]